VAITMPVKKVSQKKIEKIISTDEAKKEIDKINEFTNNLPDKVIVHDENKKNDEKPIFKEGSRTTEELRKDFFKSFKLLTPYTLAEIVPKNGRFWWLSWGYWKKKRAIDNKIHIISFVHMYLTNGNTRTFLVYEDAEGFFYQEGKYLFDKKCAKYNVDLRMNEYVYHEKFTLPFKIDIPYEEVIEVMKIMQNPEFVGDVVYATFPKLLRKWMFADFIEKILHSEELKKLLVICIIMLAVDIFLHLLSGGVEVWLLFTIKKLAQAGADNSASIIQMLSKVIK
jgi:hypothetical protein